MKTIKILTIAVLLFTATSCDLEKYDKNPNAQEMGTITPAGLMDELICSGVLNQQQRFYDTYAEFMQYTVATSTTNEVMHRYYVAPSYTSNVWNNAARWASNADHMYNIAAEQENPNYQAIALTLRAYWMDVLTSIYGYVPFEEAFRLRDDDIAQPKFDSPRSIYTQLYKDLEKANALYDTSTETLDSPGKDKLYNGKVANWKKLTNSLYLRLLIRLSNRQDEMEVAQKIKAILDDPATYPVFESNDDSAVVWFTGVSPFQNGWGSTEVSSFKGHRAGEQFMSALYGASDPRTTIFFGNISKSIGWTGAKSGMSREDTETGGYPVYRYNVFLNYALPMSFMNYDEVCFLKAEAYARTGAGWNTIVGDARTWYEKGIRASCEHWIEIYKDHLGLGQVEDTPLVTAADSNNMYHGAPISDEEMEIRIENLITTGAPYDASDPIRSIINQKYIAMFYVGPESYNDYRRTGYPELTIGNGTFNNATFPRRLVYPVGTQTTNPTSYAEVIRTLAATYYDGADDMLTPVWWSEAGLSMEIR